MPKAKNKRKLTQMTLDRATAGKERKLIWDTIQAGLALCIQPSGTRSWRCVLRWPPGSAGSKPIWLTKRGVGLQAAREWARKMHELVDSGVDPRGERAASLQAAMSFEDLSKRYVNEWARKNNRSWEQADYLVRAHLIDSIGKIPAAAVARADVRDVHQRLTQAGKSILANQVLAAAGAIYRWAIGEGVVEMAANPANGLRRNPTSKRDRWLAESEIKAVWEATFEHGAAGAALRLMLLTGQRGADVRQLRAEHIEDDEWWNIEAVAYKTGAAHRVFMTAAARKAFVEMSWGGRRTPASRESSMAGAARAICASLAQPRWTVHSLRHTVATHMARMEIADEVISRVLGHSEGGGTTAGYIHHSYDNERRRTMERWAVELRRIIDGRAAEGEVVKLTA